MIKLKKFSFNFIKNKNSFVQFLIFKETSFLKFFIFKDNDNLKISLNNEKNNFITLFQINL